MLCMRCLAPAFAAFVALAGAADAQTDFPNRRVHVIVTDTLAEIWRQPIIVESQRITIDGVPLEAAN